MTKACPISLSFNRLFCRYFNRFWFGTTMSTLPGRHHMSDSTPSLDGRGGADLASKDGKPTKRTGPNYGVPSLKARLLASMAWSTHAVYYRLYTKLGAFESNHPLYHNDHFIGRIPTKAFAPPHTLASIRRSLCRLEGLSEPDKALVFTPLSSPTPKEHQENDTLSDPSYVACHRHVRQIKTDLMCLGQAMYLSG